MGPLGITSTSCVWGCRMPVDLIIDPWNPDQRRYRTETFCYGPLSCRLYKAGPTRKVPGRRGMSYEEEDWVDGDATSHRLPASEGSLEPKRRFPTARGELAAAVFMLVAIASCPYRSRLVDKPIFLGHQVQGAKVADPGTFPEGESQRFLGHQTVSAGLVTRRPRGFWDTPLPACWVGAGATGWGRGAGVRRDASTSRRCWRRTLQFLEPALDNHDLGCPVRLPVLDQTQESVTLREHIEIGTQIPTTDVITFEQDRWQPDLAPAGAQNASKRRTNACSEGLVRFNVDHPIPSACDTASMTSTGSNPHNGKTARVRVLLTLETRAVHRGTPH